MQSIREFSGIPKVNRWFMMSWGDHLKLPAWRLTCEFTGKLMVGAVLK